MGTRDMRGRLAYHIFSNEITLSYIQCSSRERFVNQESSNLRTMQRPLEGILVFDFSQFLSGALATLRLADLGARVVKIERPGTGDLGRSLYLSDTDVHGENTLFHAINRNKESFAADLKKASEVEKLRELLRQIG